MLDFAKREVAWVLERVQSQDTSLEEYSRKCASLTKSLEHESSCRLSLEKTLSQSNETIHVEKGRKDEMERESESLRKLLVRLERDAIKSHVPLGATRGESLLHRCQKIFSAYSKDRTMLLIQTQKLGHVFRVSESSRVCFFASVCV